MIDQASYKYCRVWEETKKYSGSTKGNPNGTQNFNGI